MLFREMEARRHGLVGSSLISSPGVTPPLSLNAASWPVARGNTPGSIIAVRKRHAKVNRKSKPEMTGTTGDTCLDKYGKLGVKHGKTHFIWT